MIYQVHGPVLSAFWQSRAFVRAIRGPVGSGKSTACVMRLVKNGTMQTPGPDGVRRRRTAIIRNTYPDLHTTTIKTWHQWIPSGAGQWQKHGPPTHTLRYPMSDGTRVEHEVMFLALDTPDDVSKLLSLELSDVWVNEAREIPKAVIDGVTMRVGRYPASNAGGAAETCVLLDSNPCDTDHWWYRLAEEDRPRDFAFFSQPAGDGPEAENLNYLNQTADTAALALDHPDRLARGRLYYDRIKAGKDKDWIEVYVRGNYGFVREGKPVYPEYDDATHCRPCPPVPGLPITIGMDFGLTPAAVFMQRLPSGRAIWFDELVATDMGLTRFSEELRFKIARDYAAWQRALEIVGDPAGDQRAATNEDTCFMILRAAGFPARPAESNDFTARREAVAVPLGRLADRHPALLIDPKCKVTRKGMMGGYRYKRVQISGAERYQDKPDKNEFSHPCEAAQYGMMGLGYRRDVISRPAPRRGGSYQAATDWNPFA